MAKATLNDVLRVPASATPERAVFIVLDAAANETERITYGELDARAQVVAAALEGRIARGDRVAILCPPGIDFIVAFFGALYAGVVAVPVAPALFPGEIARLESIVADAGVKFVLTTEPLLSMTMRLAELASIEGALGRLDPLLLEALPRTPQPGRAHVPVRPDDLAFLQYTSGSIGTPKGVRVTHARVVANQQAIQEAFGNHDPSRVTIATWLPLYHDMGLGTVLQTVWLGTCCYLISPLDFLQRPLVWLRAISRFGVTATGGPNFAYELCVRRISPAQREELDLSTWALAYNGAEPVRPEVLDRFAATFGEQGFRKSVFYPTYGLAEAVLFVTGGESGILAEELTIDREAAERGEVAIVEEGGGRPLVSCGRPRRGDRISIVDPETSRLVGEGRIGEIWVSGPSVCDGYFGREAESAETFGARLADGDDERTFLRTGDLGFVHDGELFVTGRRKDMIIVRGRNHFAEDIERTLEKCSTALRPGCGVAIAVDIDGEERLVVVQEIKAASTDGLDGPHIAGEIRAAITAHHRLALHEAVLVTAGSVPKTSSGKVRRAACRTLLLEGKLTPLWRGA